MSTNPESDILATIDELLEQGEPAGEQRLCVHCGEDWHGLAVTEDLAAIRVLYRWGIPHPYQQYSYEADTSPVLCPGSDVVGPMIPLDYVAVTQVIVSADGVAYDRVRVAVPLQAMAAALEALDAMDDAQAVPVGDVEIEELLAALGHED